jgi:hypothetical protein
VKDDALAHMNREERRAYLKRNRFVSFTFKVRRTAIERLKIVPGRTDEERIATAIDAAIKQFERLRDGVTSAPQEAASESA